MLKSFKVSPLLILLARHWSGLCAGQFNRLRIGGLFWLFLHDIGLLLGNLLNVNDRDLFRSLINYVFRRLVSLRRLACLLRGAHLLTFK